MGRPFPRAQTTSEECELFTHDDIRGLMGSPYTYDKISVDIMPFFAIDCYRESIPRSGICKLRRFLNRLRGSLLDRAQYRAIVAHIKDPLVGEAIGAPPTHTQLEEWRIITARYNLTERLSLTGWIPTLRHMAGSLISRPRDL